MKDARLKTSVSTSRKGNELSFDLGQSNKYEAEVLLSFRATIEGDNPSIEVQTITPRMLRELLDSLRKLSSYQDAIRPDIEAAIEAYMDNLRESRYED